MTERKDEPAGGSPQVSLSPRSRIVAEIKEAIENGGLLYLRGDIPGCWELYRR